MSRWLAVYGVRRTALLAAAGVVAIVVLAAGLPFALRQVPPAVAPVLIVGLAIGLAAVLALVLVPVHWLPAIALLSLAIVPMQLIPSNGVLLLVRPTTLIVVVWLLRRLLTARSAARFPAALPVGGVIVTWAAAGVLTLWTGFSFARTVDPTTSAAWLASFLCGLVLPLLVLDARREARALERATVWSGGLLGIYAVIEQVAGFSPVYGTLARLGGVGDTRWAVYRSEGSFGHPLAFAAFLVVPAALGIGRWIGGGRRRDLVLGGSAAVGVVMTVSRGEMLALAGALAFLAVAALLRGRFDGRRIGALVALGAVASVGLLAFQPLVQRASSIESALSVGVRDRAVDVALRSAQASGWLGSGPGTSGISGRRYADIVIENSGLQLLMSMGIPGVLLFAALFVCVVVLAVRRRDLGAASATLGYLAAITTFNSLDAVRDMHVMLGLLVLLCLHGTGGTRYDRPQPARIDVQDRRPIVVRIAPARIRTEQPA